MEKSTLNIYKASAGSGKTFTLTAEYIKLMVQPSAEHEYLSTLAVTFTNKATSEMKNRIITSLYGIANGDVNSEDMLKAVMVRLEDSGTTMSEMKVRERCREVLSDILHDYSRFRVETIDSFFQSILRNLARELGQSANLQVELSNDELLSDAVDRIIENLQEEKVTRVQLLEYVKDLIDSGENWRITDEIKSFAKCIFEEVFQSKSNNEKSLLEDDASIRNFRKRLHQRKEEICSSASIPETLYNKLEDCELETACKYFSALKKFVTELAELTFEPSASVIKFLEDPNYLLKKNYQNNTAIIEKLSLLHEEIIKCIDNAIDPIKEVNTIKLILKNFNNLQLLGRIDKEVEEINHENDSFALAKTPFLLTELIKNEDAPFVFEKIGTVLKNVMIDEFQDTSNLQWQIFRTLLFENQSLGGNDLIVGDIKQSIYRWRGGSWNLLHNIAEEMRLWEPNEKELKTNWRSGGNIINFNNELFTSMVKNCDEKYPESRIHLSDIYSDVKQGVAPKNQDKGYVKVKEVKENEEALEEMFEEINNLYRKGLDYKSMAILVRSNQHINLIMDYARENALDIPIVSDEALLLGSSSVLQILVASLRVLVSNEKKNPVIFRQLASQYQKEVLKNNLSTNDLTLLPTSELLPKILVERSEELVNMPINLLVETLYKELNLNSIKGQDAYTFAFLDILQEHIQNYSCDIQTFLNLWDTKYYKLPIPSGKINGIRILTIHKSKGLEFHTVFIPFCVWNFTPKAGSKIWCASEEKDEEYNTFGTLPVTIQAKTMDASYFSNAYQEEVLQLRVDAYNMLYVALTRAVKNLYIWGEGKSNIFAEILNALDLKKSKNENTGLAEYSIGEPVTEIKVKKEEYNRMNPEFSHIEINMTSHEPRLNFVQSNESEQFSDERKTRINEGKLYHYIFSRIHDHRDIDSVLEQVMQEGILSSWEQKEALHRYFDEIMADDTIREWFAPENEVFNECRIIMPEGGDERKKRPDRVIRKGNSYTVIDYKFGRENEDYRKQVETYIQLLNEMYPECSVEGWLWYVDSGKRVKI